MEENSLEASPLQGRKPNGLAEIFIVKWVSSNPCDDIVTCTLPCAQLFNFLEHRSRNGNFPRLPGLRIIRNPAPASKAVVAKVKRARKSGTTWRETSEMHSAESADGRCWNPASAR